MTAETGKLEISEVAGGVRRSEFKRQLVEGMLLMLVWSVVGYDLLSYTNQQNIYPSVFFTVGWLWGGTGLLLQEILAVMFLIRPDSNALKGVGVVQSAWKWRFGARLDYSGGTGVVAFFIKVYALHEKRVQIFTFSAFALLLAVEAVICFLLS